MNAPAPSPELTKHLRAIAEDNRRDREWTSDDVFDAVEEAAGIVGSFSRSIAEAAFRHDEIQLRIYRFQFHHAVVDLMRLIRTVAPIDGAR
jgi:hypothetical protein